MKKLFWYLLIIFLIVVFSKFYIDYTQVGGLLQPSSPNIANPFG